MMIDLVRERSPAFSIALVNYRTLDLTRRCLELLKTHVDAGLPASVWVVDNDSRDASTTYLRGLDWIRLIERPAVDLSEKGYVAHGRGLDAILDQIDTEHVFLMHTDTFVHDPAIFDRMLRMMQSDEKLAAVGCLEQTHRGVLRTCWRQLVRGVKMGLRRMKLKLGMASRPPKPVLEKNIKSFFACWSVRAIRESGLCFTMGNRNPGYELQDRLVALGYRVGTIESGVLFKYLDHVKAGTKSLLPAMPNMHESRAGARSGWLTGAKTRLTI